MRRLHRALWSCLLFVLAVPVFAADPASCRDSRFPESAWTRGTDGLELNEAKLRVPSVQSARFDGQTAVIETLAGPVRIDLRSGAVLP